MHFLSAFSFQSAFSFHSALFQSMALSFYLMALYFSCIGLLFKYSKCESALFIFSLQNIMQLFRVSDPDLYPDPDPHGSALIWVAGSGSRSAFKLRIRIQIRIQECKNDPQKLKKVQNFHVFLSTGCSLLRAEGFSCSLGVLYGGLGISKLQFLIKKIEIKFQLKFFFQF